MAEKPSTPVVRLEPMTQEQTAQGGVQSAAGPSTPGWDFETARFAGLPHPRDAHSSVHREEVRVTIGQMEVRVETVKPQGAPPKAASEQADPFASLIFARRGGRTIDWD